MKLKYENTRKNKDWYKNDNNKLKIGIEIIAVKCPRKHQEDEKCKDEEVDSIGAETL